MRNKAVTKLATTGKSTTSMFTSFLHGEPRSAFSLLALLPCLIVRYLTVCDKGFEDSCLEAGGETPAQGAGIGALALLALILKRDEGH